jgi:uncharacterized protein YcnI
MIRKLVVVGAIITGVVALMAGPAFAHVEIEREGDVSSDGNVAATLHVPNEMTNAGTVKIALVFPDTPALVTAQPDPIDGWEFNVEKNAGGDVTQVVWTGGPLTGDNEVALPLTIGSIPSDTDTIEFKALQTYDNGDEVRWIEPTPPGGEEPEHPAPVLFVKGEAPADDDAAATTDDHSSTTQNNAATATKDDSSDDGLSTGAIIAIVVGVIIVLALLAWVLSRSRRDMGSKVD